LIKTWDVAIEAYVVTSHAFWRDDMMNRLYLQKEL